VSTSLPGDNNPAADGAGDALNFQHFSVALVDGHPVELGRGAMGITYKAYDRNLHVHVALKVINGAVLTSDTAKDRFLREARSAAALRHPNVAAVFYLGEQDGSVFYAMEYVDGETIEACIRREIGVSPVMALKIVAQVASALAAAQKEGIIHRDIKPSNIMLMKSDDGEVSVKVIDFGLAKSIESDPNSATVTLTQGGFLGTPHFASPEQLEEGEVDTRSDIYSLGVTLFYMLAGKTPFSGSMAQVMSQHLYRQPPLELLEGQPAVVMELLKSMLAKDPADRPQTALELKKRAEACLEELAFLGETAVTRVPAERPDIGEVVGGRFTLEAALGSAGEFLRFRARDAENPDRLVEVVMVDPAATMIPGLRDEVRQRLGVIERIEADAVRHVVAQGGSGRGWYFAIESVEGISLLRVMKARRSLELEEALVVLRPLALAADAFDAAPAPRPELAPHEIVLTPAGDLSLPLNEWPDLSVKIDALRIEHLLDVPADVTVVHSSAATLRRGDGEDAGNAAFAVAGLACELLGGARFDARSSGQWTPLSELTQDGNLVVRRALDGGFATAAEFVEALVGEGTSRPATPVARVPEAMPPPLPLPEKPAPASSAWILATVLGICALLLAAGIYFLWPNSRPAEPMAGPSATPTPGASPTATPLVTSEPNQTPTATPGAAPEREAYAAAEVQAASLEAAGNDGPALLAYAQLSAAHPEDGALFEAVKRIAQKIETEHPKGVDAAQLPALRPGLEAAGWRGSVNACVVLGHSLLKSDPVASLQWFQEAAKGGRSDAMALAGMMLSSGRGVAKPNPEAAVGWFKASAERNDPNGITYLGECYSLGYGGLPKDDRRAVELLTISSDMGDDRAMGLLGRLYESGRGVEKADPGKAFALYQSAAAKGNMNAQAQLGRLYISGVGVERNTAEAVRIWREGAEKGDAECMRLYAISLEDESISNDPRQAREWYVKSARLGNDRAIAWCQEHDVPFEVSPEATASPTP